MPALSAVIIKIADAISFLIILCNDARKWQDVLFLANIDVMLSSMLRGRCGRYRPIVVLKMGVFIVEMLVELKIIILYRHFHFVHTCGEALASDTTSATSRLCKVQIPLLNHHYNFNLFII